MKIKKGFEFEVGKVYFTKYRLDRVYFEVVKVTLRTVVLKHIGIQHDQSFESPSKFSRVNGETQRVTKRYEEVNTEYGFVKNAYARVRIPECVLSQYWGFEPFLASTTYETLESNVTVG